MRTRVIVVSLCVCVCVCVVPRHALWKVLDKIGVPPTMLQIIKSFHDGMRADARVGDTSTDSF